MRTSIAEAIRNPLAMIAMFAAIAEIAMAVVLLQLPEPLQSTFIWFVMAFPMVLVIGFYIVLYRKPAALFSPSDYKDDQLYLRSIIPDLDEDANSTRVAQLEESVKSLQLAMDRLARSDAADPGLIEELSEQRRKLELTQKIGSNNLFAFLTSEIALDTNQVIELIKSTDDVRQLPEKIGEMTGNEWNMERVARTVENFPKMAVDYQALNEELSLETSK